MYAEEAREAVRYLIYEEMRLYRPSATRFAAPVVTMPLTSDAKSTRRNKTSPSKSHRDEDDDGDEVCGMANIPDNF